MTFGKKATYGKRSVAALVLVLTAHIAWCGESTDRHLLIGDYIGKSLTLYSQSDGVVWRHKADGTIVWAGYAGIQRLHHRGVTC